MMYLRSMIVPTLLLSMIGLALPSDPQRKMAKGSKKNPPASSRREEIPIALMVPEAMSVVAVKREVTKKVRDILYNNERRGLAIIRRDKLALLIRSMIVKIKGMTENECPPNSLPAAVCYAAIIMVDMKEDLMNSIEDLMGRIPNLEDALDKVISIRDRIFVARNSSNGKQGIGYKPVRITNLTPYDMSTQNRRVSARVDYSGFGLVCYPDFIRIDTVCNYDVTPTVCTVYYKPIPAGETWTVKDTSRGFCLVSSISGIALELEAPPPENPNQTPVFLECDSYESSGTHYSDYFIIMTGDDSCAVQSIGSFTILP